MQYADLDSITDIIDDLEKNRERIISAVVAYETRAENGEGLDTSYSFSGGANTAIGLCETTKKALLESGKQ
jgi:hypothetical protein